jgi:hypothetical protein
MPAMPVALHFTTHLPMNKFCEGTELKQRPTQRRRYPEMVEKQELCGHTLLGGSLDDRDGHGPLRL